MRDFDPNLNDTDAHPNPRANRDSAYLALLNATDPRVEGSRQPRGEILPPGYVPIHSADPAHVVQAEAWPRNSGRVATRGWFQRGFAGVIAAAGATQVGVEVHNALTGAPVDATAFMDGVVATAVATPLALSASVFQPRSSHLADSLTLRLLGTVGALGALANGVAGGVELAGEGLNYLAGQPVNPTNVLHGVSKLGLSYTSLKVAKYIMSE